jgi:predicted signal transduction protein with EAL and GGDEF domain
VRIAQAACGATVARFGGDEFVVLVEGDRPEAEKIADEILRRLREPHAVEGTSVVLAGSIGIALSPEHGVTASELMRRADLALYRAKELGKDRLVLFNHEMDHSLQARQQLEQDLRAAIDAGEISVVYQPQVCRDSGRMIGVEALARWCHVTRGDVSPAVFVPIAEEAGLIRHLDRLVLRSACSAAAHWDDIMVSVNVSPIELRAPTYASEVRHVLLETGLPPRRLKLEITETALLTSASTAAKIVQELRAMGVKLTLDDFGTGYSSLDHLRTLKLDGMKIDRSFVANSGSDADSHRTIEALIERQSADNFHADDLSLGGVLALPLTVLPSTA